MPRRPTDEVAPGHYQHFKGGFYEVLGMADDPESGKRYVVYRSHGLMEKLVPADPANPYATDEQVVKTPTAGALAVCSVARFTELVDGKEFHPGRQVPRFKPVDRVPPRG